MIGPAGATGSPLRAATPEALEAFPMLAESRNRVLRLFGNAGLSITVGASEFAAADAADSSETDE